ncbi:CHAT domain-containing protein [Streptomyces sp. NPDC051105]|uniref:CHAT domain-containing protein n=1 Tax=Streptomyces sp. NPDC051105 TaxID=3154843 RepID=UPI0034231A41
MRKSQETRVIATMSKIDGATCAGLVVGTPVQWSVAPVSGRSPSMLMQAYEGRLPRIPAMGREMFTLEAPPGWAARLDPVMEELYVTSPVNPRFCHGAVPPLPPGWRETAVTAGRVLLLVTDFLKDYPAGSGADLADALTGLATHGLLHGGMIEFVESAVPAEPDSGLALLEEDTPPPLTLVRAPADALVELAELVADRVLTLDQAKSRARQVGWITFEQRKADNRPNPPAVPGGDSARTLMSGSLTMRPGDDPRELLREMTDREIAAVTLPSGPMPLEHALREHYYYLCLLVEIADARGGPEGSPLWLAAAAPAVEAAAHLVSVTGDRAAFEEADELARRRVAFLRSQHLIEPLDDALIAAAELRLALLGPLHLGGDQYARSGLPCTTAELVSQAYLAQEDGLQPPDIRTHISDANAFLDEALQTTQGRARARALVLRIQAGIPRDQPYSLSGEQIRALAGEARSCFRGAEGPVVDLFLARLLEDMPSGAVAGLFARPLESVVDAYGEPGTRALLSQGIEMARALGERDLLHRMLPWSDELPEPLSDAHVRQELEARLHCLPDDSTPCPPRGADLDALAGRLFSSRPRFLSSSHRTRREAAARTHLAAHALAEGQTELGLRLLPPFESIRTLGHSYSLLYADLHYQAATTCPALPQTPRGDLDMQGPGFLLCQAAQKYSLLGLYGLARACLIQVLEHVQDSSDDDFPAVASAVAATTPVIYPIRDRALARICRDVVHATTLRASMEAEGVSLAALMALHHAAKGATFSQWYGIREPFEMPEAVMHQLTRLRAIADRGEAGPYASNEGDYDVGLPGTSLGDLLVPLSDQEIAPGRTGAEIEQNVRRHIDDMINRVLVQAGVNGSYAETDWDRVQESLDGQTVFLSWFVPATPGFETDYAVLAITQESVTGAFVHSGPSTRNSGAEGHDGDERMPPPHDHLLADTVDKIRVEVTDDPQFDHVTPEAADLLARPLIPPQWLEEWREQGKDHLRIWAHGPLHYLPFHLLTYGPEARLVADDFTVSLIGGLGTSSPRGSAARRPPRTAVLAAASGGEAFGLTRETVLEEHAADIADLIGASAVVGPAATRQRLLEELSTADVVHIAAHGTQDAAAPWFHCLYLSPDEDDDGRVFAQDILATDLRGVRLVTLASCESALGRYDINDNLRGMPAALLLAGAQAIIGCLWPVRPEPATHFFGEVHQRIARGSTPLEAFRGAQFATRACCPDYRDWGAFTFLQGWHHTTLEAM